MGIVSRISEAARLIHAKVTPHSRENKSRMRKIWRVRVRVNVAKRMAAVEASKLMPKVPASMTRM